MSDEIPRAKFLVWHWRPIVGWSAIENDTLDDAKELHEAFSGYPQSKAFITPGPVWPPEEESDE